MTTDAHLPATTTPLGTTPASTDLDLQLRNAAEFGNVAAIDTLVDAGVNPNACNCADNTALHYARPGAGAPAPSRHCSPLVPTPTLATPTGPRPSTLRSGSATAKQPMSLGA